MTQTTATFLQYNQELAPKVREILLKKDILKEWKTTDEECLAFAEELEEVNARYKAYVEKAEADLLREIKDLETDLKEGLKGMAKVSNGEYKPAELKAFLVARAKETVEKVKDKGELFADLEKELA